MKLHFLGTCSGSEPMTGRHHTSTALEINGRLYFLDAGESCSYTAHLRGLDLLTTRSVIVSHPHMDHIGGLCNLLWTIRKLVRVQKRPPIAEALPVYLPSATLGQAVESLLNNAEHYLLELCSIEMKTYRPGTVMDDGDLRVTAFPNTHVQPVNGVPYSYSFLLECEGRRVAWSGDIRSCSELDDVIGEGCDALIVETGHHKIADVHAYVQGKRIGKVFFTHHGREILNDPEAAEARIFELFGNSAVLCNDGMEVEL